MLNGIPTIREANELIKATARNVTKVWVPGPVQQLKSKVLPSYKSTALTPSRLVRASEDEYSDLGI